MGFIARGNAELAVRPTPDQAARLMQKVLEGYPDLKPHDGKGYMASITKAFLNYPLGVGMAIAEDFPKRHEFNPKLAQVIGALEVEKTRVQMIIGLAMMHPIERRRRAEEKAKEASYLKTPEMKTKFAKFAESLRSMGGKT